MGPAPFDDIGDIPYHEGKTDGTTNTLRSLEAPYLPRLLSTPSTANINGSVHATATNPDTFSSLEAEEGREYGETDRRHTVNSSAVLNGSSFRTDGNYQQNKRRGNSQRDQSQNSQYTIHHNEPQVEVIYNGHDLNNHSNHCLKAHRHDDAFNNGHDRGCDNICVNNRESVPHSPQDVSLGQQTSRCLVSASCQGDSKVETDPCPKTVTSLCAQVSQTHRKASRRCCGQQHPLPSRTAVPPACADNAVPLCYSAPLPASPLAFHRHAWEERE